MPSIAQDLQQILDLATHYSRNATPAMQARDQASKHLQGELRSVLASARSLPRTVDLDLDVAVGGRQASYSPLAWVRIYSPQHSPHATAGIYLTYLFAADGSRVYLSLNQGSSEIRSGHMRPVNSPQLLWAHAAEARSAIRTLIESPLGTGTTVSIDLGLANISSVGAYSQRRMRNYEFANILAIEYESGNIPADGQLLADVYRLLPLLSVLYGGLPFLSDEYLENLPDDSISGGRAGTTTDGQGPLADAVKRRAIEIHAEDIAVEHFQKLAWDVRRVGALKLGYDLECTNGKGQIIHVEVKGTQTLGEEVVLTRNEERHNRLQSQCGADHALYVLSEIKVVQDSRVHCTDGNGRCIWPWTIDPEYLTPTEYAYCLPKG